MTANVIRRLADLENARHNKAQENETMRSNLANEMETRRSNIARESENQLHNRTTEAETQRSNRATEAETHRSNLANEGLKGQSLLEDVRHNTATEALTSRSQTEIERSNRAKEFETERHNYAAERETIRSNMTSEGLRSREINLKEAEHSLNKVKVNIEQGKLDLAKEELLETMKRNKVENAATTVNTLFKGVQTAGDLIAKIANFRSNQSNTAIALVKLLATILGG